MAKLPYRMLPKRACGMWWNICLQGWTSQQIRKAEMVVRCSHSQPSQAKEVAELLLARESNSVDAEGKTPRIWAEAEGHHAVALLFS